MLLQGIRKEAPGKLGGELARAGHNLATNGSNGANCRICAQRRSDTISTMLPFFAILQCVTIFTFAQFGCLDAGQILARSDQSLARFRPDAGQNPAGIWPDSGQDLARTWRDAGKSWSEAGQSLARFWQCPALCTRAS